MPDTSPRRKQNLLGSIFGLTCPKCRKGNLFPTYSFSFQQPFDMYEECPQCGFNYHPEPGFYYGAMFLSYILSGFICLAIVAIFRYGLGWSLTASFASLIAIALICFVWFFRFSRSLWIHMMFRYDPERAAGDSHKGSTRTVRRT